MPLYIPLFELMIQVHLGNMVGLQLSLDCDV